MHEGTATSPESPGPQIPQRHADAYQVDIDDPMSVLVRTMSMAVAGARSQLEVMDEIAALVHRGSFVCESGQIRPGRALARRLDQAGRCPTPRKAAFRDRAGAEQRLGAMMRRARRKRICQRVYLCDCGRWHLTSSPEREGLLPLDRIRELLDFAQAHLTDVRLYSRPSRSAGTFTVITMVHDGMGRVTVRLGRKVRPASVERARLRALLRGSEAVTASSVERYLDTATPEQVVALWNATEAVRAPVGESLVVMEVVLTAALLLGARQPLALRMVASRTWLAIPQGAEQRAALLTVRRVPGARHVLHLKDHTVGGHKVRVLPLASMTREHLVLVDRRLTLFPGYEDLLSGMLAPARLPQRTVLTGAVHRGHRLRARLLTRSLSLRGLLSLRRARAQGPRPGRPRAPRGRHAG